MEDRSVLETGWKMDGLRHVICRIFGTRQEGGGDPDRLRVVVRGIMTARPDEIGCADCSERMARLVEMVRAGARTAAVMPLVQDHLARCRDCREEYEALLVAVRATARADRFPGSTMRGERISSSFVCLGEAECGARETVLDGPIAEGPARRGKTQARCGIRTSEGARAGHQVWGRARCKCPVRSVSQKTCQSFAMDL
jgi:hypothetical protein